MGLLNSIAGWTARSEFARSAIEEKADLGPFTQRPSPRVIAGIILMGFSYIIGWPAVALFGVLSIWLRQPLIVIIGGPVIYGISHLVFLAGLYCAGARYTYVFLRWAARRFIEKYGPPPVPGG